jgi:uncharacterized repeat protein (TIGR02543 family)
MYEETKIRFDWKGFLIKFAILIIVIILVIKLLPFERKSISNEYSDSFNSNITKLKNTALDFFSSDNLPKTLGESKTTTLEDLENTGKISELKAINGKSCDKTKSYIKATKNTAEYEINVYLKCGTESQKIYIYKTDSSISESPTSKATTKISSSKKTSKKTTSTTTTTTKSISNDNQLYNDKDNSYVQTTRRYTTSIEYYTSVVTKEKKYAVVFDTYGGYAISTQYLRYGEIANMPSNPIKDGYIFMGWFYNNDEFDFNTPITKNIILVASWKKNA